MNTSHISDHDSLRLREIRRLERIFIYHRWLYIVAILLLAAVYRELPITAIIILSLFLGICNIITWRIYRNLDTVKKQTTLSLCMLAADGLASWGLMLLFLRDPTAIVYAVFALIVIEGAVRFGLTGSLLTGTFFIVGLSTAWILRVSLLDMSFDWAAYIFWVGLITLISIMIGMVVRESLKQRAYAESLSTEKTLLLERRRISNELHDTVLKSLQGLALEAHALSKNAKDRDVSFVEARAHYIEEVCNNTSQEIRGVVFELHDGNPATNGDLKQQLSSLVEDWSKKSSISAEIIFRGEPPVLPFKLAHDLRRILGEALANVQRHSCASLVKVLLTATPEMLTLEVSDNGKGFTCQNDDLYPFVSNGKLGLVSMKERAEMAGGSININSNTKGTTLLVSIPLKS